VPGWSEERSERLKKLWGDGLSASQCAMSLGGTTRNAVISKVHRMGLGGRKTQVRQKFKSRKRPIYRGERLRPSTMKMPHTPLKPLPSASEFDIPRIPFKDRRANECSWIVNDPKEDDRCCGLETVPTTPFCFVHLRRAFPGVEVRLRALASSSPEKVEEMA